MLWFSINPDGQNMMANWYRSNLGTPYEVSNMPGLYQEYIGHDNNRDGYMNNMIESQVITRTELEYYPQVFYNHHQTAPFPARIWIPPFGDPVSLNPHPLMYRWVNVFGTAMAAWLDEHDMPGAMHRGRFDDWYPGFRRPRQQFPQYGLLPDRDGAVPLRDAALLHHRRFPAREAGSADGGLLLEPLDGRLVAAGRRGALHARRFDGGAGYRGQESRGAAVRPLSARAAT